MFESICVGVPVANTQRMLYNLSAVSLAGMHSNSSRVEASERRGTAFGPIVGRSRERRWSNDERSLWHLAFHGTQNP
jgi:hypothetical protein